MHTLLFVRDQITAIHSGNAATACALLRRTTLSACVAKQTIDKSAVIRCCKYAGRRCYILKVLFITGGSSVARQPIVINVVRRSYASTATAQEKTSEVETHTFQAETRELLKIVAGALYSRPEASHLRIPRVHSPRHNTQVFVRELISNASDALEKLRYEKQRRGEDATDLCITISCDPETRTFTIQDNGIGMTKQEVGF